MIPTLIDIEIAVASAATTIDVRASEAVRLRPAINPAAPGIRRSGSRRKRIPIFTHAGEIKAAAATAHRMEM